MNQAYFILSSMLNSNSKTENAGAVLNEIEIQPSTIENLDIKICLYVMTILMVINFLYHLYGIMQRRLKKKYTATDLI